MNWLFWKHKKEVEWEVQPRDQHWNGQEASVILEDGWELYGVSPVPNISDPYNWVRLWFRRPTNWKKSKPYEVKVQSAGWGGHQVLLHLTAHWTPFGLSISPPDQPIVWFWRRADAA